MLIDSENVKTWPTRNAHLWYEGQRWKFDINPLDDSPYLGWTGRSKSIPIKGVIEVSPCDERGWIVAKLELPEEGKDVLVFCPVFRSKNFAYLVEDGYGKMSWYGQGVYFACVDSVTHWMPEPPDPVGVSEDGEFENDEVKHG